MIGVIGSGAFGTALAVALGRDGREVRLLARDAATAASIHRSRRNKTRLPGVALPELVSVTADIQALDGAEAVLLAVPMQALRGFLARHAQALNHLPLIACCKGIDLQTMKGPTGLIAESCPGSVIAMLTGPSFAADIARGLPTALTLACADPLGVSLQKRLSTPVLRLYLTTDLAGAELGGGLKNIIAIAAGVVIGAGLGESARAALITRGYVEMQRLALQLGARAETLAGLSGLGDMVLTCTSAQSRNFRFGLSIGSGSDFDASITVEGAATALAVAKLADSLAIDMPITKMVAALVSRSITLSQAIQSLLSRPLKQE